MFVDVKGNLHTHQCKVPDGAVLSPCLFEYVYFARPDSVLDKVPVYEGEMLTYFGVIRRFLFGSVSNVTVG